MKSTSETGHAKNVANFQDLIEFVTAYGDIYNPSKKNLQLSQLIILKSAADNNLADTLTKKTQYNTRVNQRINTFSDLRPLATRLVNALQSTDATPQTIADAKTYNRKIQGKKASSSQPQTDTPMHPYQTPYPQASYPMTSSYSTSQDFGQSWKTNKAMHQTKLIYKFRPLIQRFLTSQQTIQQLQTHTQE